jgi:gliding motility-associated-like protein
MNETFKPSICKTPDYTMRIYNRWGEILFETHDIDVGWNGMFQNKKVPEGAYVYYIQARNRDKTFINRKGDFYVILPSK